MLSKLISARRSIAWRLYLYLKPLFSKFFVEQERLFNQAPVNNLRDLAETFPSALPWDLKRNYFILHASYGDKWCILSYLKTHLDLYGNSLVIASTSDRELVRIFVGETILNQRFLFVAPSVIVRISRYFRPVSSLGVQIIDPHIPEIRCETATRYLLEKGLPPATIRHLHIVTYPYFCELFLAYAITYGTLMKVILYLPATLHPCQPSYYHHEDHFQAARLLGDSSSDKRTVLLNFVNFTHQSFSFEQIKTIVELLNNLGYFVLLNTSQASCSSCYEPMRSAGRVDLISVPSHLMALLSSRVYAVIGVLCGAMAVAGQFSSAHLLSLQTPYDSSGVPEEELFGAFGKQSYWSWIGLDWPCLKEGRVIENVFIEDPATCSSSQLEGVVRSFLGKLSSI